MRVKPEGCSREGWGGFGMPQQEFVLNSMSHKTLLKISEHESEGTGARIVQEISQECNRLGTFDGHAETNHLLSNFTFDLP